MNETGVQKSPGLNPFFITIEGGEGTGKTTLIAHLEDILKRKGYQVLVTREPGGTSLGEEIRRLLLETKEKALGKRAELFLFLAQRAQNVEEVIRPALDCGKIVICDRFNDSTVAYQGIARGLGRDFVRELCNFSCQSLEPTLTLLLDVDPKIGLARAKKTTLSEIGDDRIESEDMEFHKKVRASLLEISKKEPERVHVIDVSLSLVDVFKQAEKIVFSHLKKHT